MNTFNLDRASKIRSLRKTRAAGMAEYVILLVLVLMAAYGVMKTLGGNIKDRTDDVGKKFEKSAMPQ